MTPDQLVALVSAWGYAVMVPIAILEGPAIVAIGAFLASLGLLNVYLVYAIGLFGDIVGDLLRYYLGVFGQKTLIPKYGPYIGITPQKISALKDSHFDKKLWRTIFFGKFTHAPNFIILVTAGAVRVDLRRFVMATASASAIKTLVFVILGFYFGKSYSLLSAYLKDAWIVFIPLVLVVLWYLYKNHR
jgi:membrane protein DedA with SNARE-associated domain